MVKVHKGVCGVPFKDNYSAKGEFCQLGWGLDRAGKDQLGCQSETNNWQQTFMSVSNIKVTKHSYAS